MNIKKEDLIINKGIYREYNSPYNISNKLYRVSIKHKCMNLEVTYMSKISLDHAEKEAWTEFYNKAKSLSYLN